MDTTTNRSSLAEDVGDRETRAHTRFRVIEEVLCAFDPTQRPVVSRSCDISLGGIGIWTDECLAVGTVGTVWLPQNGGGWMPVIASVRYCKEDAARPGAFRVGLQTVRSSENFINFVLSRTATKG